MRKLLLVAAAGALAMLGGACRTSTSTTTSPPTGQNGNFELVAHVDSVTTGVRPDVNVPLPTATPSSDDQPTEVGVMNVTIQSMSDEVRDTCNLKTGATTKVWWSTDTRFNPKKVLANLKGELPGQRISAQGRIYRLPTSTPNASSSPASIATPEVSSSITTNACALLAEHVEVSQGTGGNVSTTSTPSPTASADMTASPRASAEPTATP